MTTKAAIQSQWDCVPVDVESATRFASTARCVLCQSKLLVAIKRPPIDAFRVHCNHCGSEVPIAVMINRAAWTITARL